MAFIWMLLLFRFGHRKDDYFCRLRLVRVDDSTVRLPCRCRECNTVRTVATQAARSLRLIDHVETRRGKMSKKVEMIVEARPFDALCDGQLLERCGPANLLGPCLECARPLFRKEDWEEDVNNAFGGGVRFRSPHSHVDTEERSTGSGGPKRKPFGRLKLYARGRLHQ